ncbi:MAG TPA: peptidylprolyl isomerase [Thermoanaerobaculia bacterium]|nr:peptidylprolyl isomerase [Thermoanaerobaculia bacterium]
MKTTRSVAALAAALGSLAALGCQTAPPPPSTATTTAAAPTPMPSPAAPAVAHAEHIKLQHILIAFAGKVPGKNITRSQDEARALANQVLERAKKGEDFDSLVRTYTDDRAPGLYSLSNSGVAPAAGEFSRDRMVPAFGNVGFSLAPGEIGMAEYDPRTSPYGWHIIKRLE